MPSPACVALTVLLALLGSGGEQGRASPPAAPSRTERLFHEGVRRYGEGDSEAALALFREVVRREPSHRGALAAIRRLEAEAARPRERQAAPPAGRGDGIRRFFFETIPRWFKGGGSRERTR